MVRDGGGRRGAAAGRRRGRGRGAPAAPVGGDKAGKINQTWYERSLERFTWNEVLSPLPVPMKRIRILPQARSREKNIPGSCVYYSIATALEAANRVCGEDVGELAWEDLYNMVSEDSICRISSALRVLKYHGIRRRVDYEKGNINGKRFKISQFSKFCNVDVILEDAPCGLDQHNTKGAINNMLSRTVLLAHFPISRNYFDLFDGGEHIYAFDKDDRIHEDYSAGATEGIPTHVVVVTGFGFEETTPYFEFLDCNGKKFGKNGFGRILPSSIISLYAFDIVLD